MQGRGRQTALGAAIILSLAAILAGCGIRDRLVTGNIERQAARMFPVGANASAFEKWLRAQGAVWPDLGGLGKPARGCEPRTILLQKQLSCMATIKVDYCVDPAGKLTRMSIKTGGYC